MGMWDDDESNEEFRDIPQETTKEYSQQNPVQQAPAKPMPGSAKPQPGQMAYNGATNRFEEPVNTGPTDEEFLESVLESVETEEDYSEVLNDANLRIEQGRLYQMIMNHDLFDGMEADERAVSNVQREIRKFARERMEIMLGMRQEQVQQTMVSSPFNDLEVDILKKLASKATNGATETPEANQVAAAVREAPRRAVLKPLGGSTGLKPQLQPKFAQSANLVPKTPQNNQKLPAKPAAPIKRSKNDAVIDQILAEEGVTRAELELEYAGIGKPLHELTAEELSQRQKATAARLASKKTVKSSSALPMASPEQQEFLAVQRASQMGQAPGMAALLAKVKEMPIKNP